MTLHPFSAALLVCGSVACSGGGSLEGHLTDAGRMRDGAPEEGRSRDGAIHDASSQDARRDARRPEDAVVVRPDSRRDVEAAERDAEPAVEDAGADGDAANGPPELVALAASPLALEPPFSPEIHDYAVRCAAGDNSLWVTAAASPGARAKVTRPTLTRAAPRLSLMLDAQPDDAVVVTATKGLAATEYWVRCLPPDFPTLSMQPHPEAGTPPPGYYLLGNTFLAPGESGYAMVLDVRGVPVWYAKTLDGAGGKTVDLLDPNTISFVAISGYTFGTFEGSFELHSLRPVGIRTVTSVAAPLDTHELRRLPNGDYLVFASPIETGVNLTGLASYGANSDMLDCLIQEISPAGELVWQWKATDHFDVVKETTYAGTVGAKDDAGQSVRFLDAFHCNSIDWNANGDLLVSARDLDAVFLVSRSTGKVLWKMGGAAYNKDGAKHIAVTGDVLGGFYRQHDARFLPDGTISLFDDESARPGVARALVLSFDESAGTATIVWQYAGTAPTDGMGSVTILADGSRVIGWGLPAGDNPAFTELDPQGNDLLDFWFPDRDSSYRAIKVPASAVDLETLRTAVGAWSSAPGPRDSGSGG